MTLSLWWARWMRPWSWEGCATTQSTLKLQCPELTAVLLRGENALTSVYIFLYYGISTAKYATTDPSCRRKNTKTIWDRIFIFDTPGGHLWSLEPIRFWTNLNITVCHHSFHTISHKFLTALHETKTKLVKISYMFLVMSFGVLCYDHCLCRSLNCALPWCWPKPRTNWKTLKKKNK